ncbi:GAF domain-containing protein [Amaricoccus macauensis]|uniref:GAF domain-containing protein n=1 Tax=Amaricoccus macauensis TaxID=57001 RepID=UPI003C7D0763
MSTSEIETHGAEGGLAVSAGLMGAGSKPFIRATEIWVPTSDRRRLELGAGLYPDLPGFEAASRGISFGYDEGLPGKAWAGRCPIVLKNLTSSYFMRGEAAEAARLTCGVAVPVFAGSFLMAVLVLFCGDDRDHVGALEVWHAPSGSNEMGLLDGYFGTAEVFEWSARHTKFPKGAGLPGLTWETGLPVVLEDLGRSKRFLRWESAERVGINRGVGIPCGTGPDGAYVLTFLSALGTPIARRFESWVPNAEGDGLILAGGFCESTGALAQCYEGQAIAPGMGTIGHAWRAGIPAISTELARDAPLVAASIAGTALRTMVAMPVIEAGKPRAVAAWYL